MKVTYFTKPNLMIANRLAIANNLNRSVDSTQLSKLPSHHKFPVLTLMDHNGCWRVKIGITMNDSIYIDIPMAVYKSLIETIVLEDA